MKILIYDDDLEELTQLSELLESLLSKRHIQADVQGVSTQQDFHNYLAQEEPDVVFLDIYLDDEAMGTELAKELREAKKNFSLIFVSTSNSHAWESYAVGADYYLLKPVTEASLGGALDKLEVFHPTQLITIDTGRRYLSFNIDKIVAIEIRDKLCFMGCPHMSLQQLIDWTEKVSQSLKEAGRTRVCIPTVFTAAPAVLKKFQETPYAETLKATGVITSYICPLMYMNNPLSEKILPIISPK